MNIRALCLLCVLTGPVAAGLSPGEVETGFDPQMNNTVTAAALQPDGNIVCGGAFTSAGGLSRLRCCRLVPDGQTETAFNPPCNGQVFTIAVQEDGRILLGGEFTSVAGVTRGRIARLLADGSLDTGFVVSAGYSVWSILPLPDGRILVGGDFGTFNGADHNRIVRLLPDGSVDPSFTASVNDLVTVLALQPDNKILVGGSYSSVNGTARRSIARLNVVGTLDTTFNANLPSGGVNCIVPQSDGRILIGGTFTFVGAFSRDRMARLHENGTVDAGFDPRPGNQVFSMSLQTDGKILVTGPISKGHQRFLADGTSDSAYNPTRPALSGVAGAGLLPDGNILLHGNFTMVAGQAQGRMAKLRNDFGTATLIVPDRTRVQWLRNGAVPEVTRVTFEVLGFNSTTWALLGTGIRTGDGWELGTLSLPWKGRVRARARVSGGHYNGSSGVLEHEETYSFLSPQQEWRCEFFDSQENTGDGADNADPDKDGLENLIEFAFGLNPHTPDAAALPKWELDDDDYSLSFTRPAGVDGITYIGEYSPSMAPGSWTPAVSVGTLPAYHFLAPAIAERQYLRVRVTSP